MTVHRTTLAANAEVPYRPLLMGLYHTVPFGADRVLVANAGRVVSLSGPSFAHRVGPLLSALDGTATRDELEARFPDLAPAVLPALVNKGLLTDAAPITDTTKVGPSLASMSFPDAPSSAEAVRRLADAVVTLPSCGPVGGQVAVLLAKAGVGGLVLSDARQVTPRDVAVSAPLGPGHTGQHRASAIAHVCIAAGAAVEVVESSPVQARSPAGQLAVLELGYDHQSWSQADACLANGMPYLLVSQDALQAWIGPLAQLGGRPCHHCLRARRLSHESHPEEHLAYMEARAASAPGPDAFLAAHTAVVAGIVASEALRSLLEAHPLTHGAVLVLDLANMTVTRELLQPVPGCEVCIGAERLP